MQNILALFPAPIFQYILRLQDYSKWKLLWFSRNLSLLQCPSWIGVFPLKVSTLVSHLPSDFFSSLTGRTTLYPLLQNERKYFRSLLRSHLQKPLLLIGLYRLLFLFLFWPFSLLKYDMPDYMQTPMQYISELS